MDNNHPKYLGMSGMHGRFSLNQKPSVNVIWSLAGVRFTDRATGNKQKFASKAKIIHLDIDSAEHGKNIDATLQILGDLNFCTYLHNIQIRTTKAY